MYPGKLIIIDGMDGAGKSTAMTYTETKLREKGIDATQKSVWLTNPLSHLCRSIIVRKEQGLHPVQALSLAVAGVLHSYHEVVVPDLERGRVVLLDRGPRSSLALQVYPNKEDHPQLLDMWQTAFSHLKVAREISIVSDATAASKRILTRSGSLDGIEAKGAEWHARTRLAYTADKDETDIIVNDGTIAEFYSKLDVVVNDIAVSVN